MAYFPYPDSLPTLLPHMQAGLIGIGVFAVISLGTTISLLVFMIYRMFNSSKYYATPLRYNQSVILILNLILADLQQALSFVISLHWAAKGAILAPTATCSTQAWLVQIGDVTSGLFSLAIAMQTFVLVVFGIKINHNAFVVGVLGIWVFALALSIAGPLKYHHDYFVRAGAWCWINEKYDTERLYFHYLWIFICEFGSLALYCILFVILQRRINGNAVSGVENHTARRVAKYMLLYPVAYTCLTLPLAAGRMATISGRNPSETFFLVAGALMTSSGWVDVVLYSITRTTIVFSTSGAAGNSISLPRYGTTTTVTNRAHGDSEHSHNGSQENIVKMERVVEVTVEERTNSNLAPDSGKPSVNW